MFNLNIEETAKVDAGMPRVQAIILVHGVLKVGLYGAKQLVDNNFPGHGLVSVHELGRLIRTYAVTKGL